MPDFKMDYEMMQEMASAFEQGANQLEEAAQAVANLAAVLENGALLGKTGAALAAILNSTMTQKIMKLSNKYQELRGDILAAMNDAMREDDQIAASFN